MPKPSLIIYTALEEARHHEDHPETETTTPTCHTSELARAIDLVAHQEKDHIDRLEKETTIDTTLHQEKSAEETTT